MFNGFCPRFCPVWYTVRKVVFLQQLEYYSCTCERPIVQPWFVPRRNVTGFAVTVVVTYSETDSALFNDTSVYNVRKLDFQANPCEGFAESKKQHYCVDLVLGWGV